MGPKWPDVARIWILNNLLLVTLVEEALFRGYMQGNLSERLKHLPHGDNLALLLTATLFGLAHGSAGWQWVLLATLAGLGTAWPIASADWPPQSLRTSV